MTVIAIDGPAGAGKTTIARGVADALGWDYVDTGAMYRAITLGALRRGVDPADASAVERVAREAKIVSAGRTISLDGEDVSEAIRTADVTRSVPVVAAHAGVRASLVELQREAARTRDVVMEGRDIGSVVVPDAPVKVFLTASLEERARRRTGELGLEPSRDGLAGMEARIAERDAADSTREASPLQRAPDAIEIDTTGRSIEDITRAIVALASERLGAR